jgi:hypothetical protein
MALFLKKRVVFTGGLLRTYSLRNLRAHDLPDQPI